MRRIILGLALTLDGFIEGPRGEYDWCFTDQDYGMKDFLSGIDAIFYGRKSYELMKTIEGGNPFAKIKSYVFSNTLPRNEMEFEVVSGEVAVRARAIKELPGKNIWLFGGASLTTTFLNEGLVDELWLSVHPLLLGSGKLLFRDITRRIHLKLLETKAYETGLVSLRYSVAGG